MTKRSTSQRSRGSSPRVWATRVSQIARRRLRFRRSANGRDCVAGQAAAWPRRPLGGPARGRGCRGGASQCLGPWRLRDRLPRFARGGVEPEQLRPLGHRHGEHPVPRGRPRTAHRRHGRSASSRGASRRRAWHPRHARTRRRLRRRAPRGRSNGGYVVRRAFRWRHDDPSPARRRRSARPRRLPRDLKAHPDIEVVAEAGDGSERPSHLPPSTSRMWS